MSGRNHGAAEACAISRALHWLRPESTLWLDTNRLMCRAAPVLRIPAAANRNGCSCNRNIQADTVLLVSRTIPGCLGNPSVRSHPTRRTENSPGYFRSPLASDREQFSGMFGWSAQRHQASTAGGSGPHGFCRNRNGSDYHSLLFRSAPTPERHQPFRSGRLRLRSLPPAPYQ